MRFKVADLGSQELASAWPLVRSVAPEADLEQWESFGAALLERGGGIVTVSGEDEVILGVATYEPADKLRLGKVLQVEVLVTFELTRRAPVRLVLCDALDRIAPLLGCEAVAVTAPGRTYVSYVTSKMEPAAAGS